jgi:aryl-alcohol dehydrogenase-like predicted oxidoreductase
MSKLIGTLSRRTMLETGLAAAAAVALPTWGREADASKLQIIKKKIPSTGEKVPVIGIGTNAFHMTDYDLLHEVLKRMHELGGRVIETASGYRDSETVIGKALEQDNFRKQMFIATKCDVAGAMPGPQNGGPPLESVYGLEAFERSLTRLQTDYVDLMQVHHLASLEAFMPVIQKLKKDGKVRYIGVTTVSTQEHPLQEHPQLIECMRKYPIDFIQVDYSLGNREAAKTVFPVARERKIAVMVAVPLGGHFGSLMNQISNRQLPSWAADIDATSWSQFFLKYVISHPDVTCAIPGSTQPEHVEDDQMAGHGRIANAAMRKRMEEFWDSKDSA